MLFTVKNIQSERYRRKTKCYPCISDVMQAEAETARSAAEAANRAKSQFLANMAAGVEVRHLPCRGQIHTSLLAVDMVVSGAAARAEMGAALRQFFGVAAPACHAQAED